MKLSHKTEAWTPAASKENPLGETEDLRGATSKGDSHSNTSKADNHPKGVSRFEANHTNTIGETSGVSAQQTGNRRERISQRRSPKEKEREKSDTRTDDETSPDHFGGKEEISDDCVSEPSRRKSTPRSEAWHSPGGGAFLRKSHSPKTRKHQGASKQGPRQLKKAGQIQDSVFDAFAHEAGKADSRKDKKKDDEPTPQELFLMRLKEMKYQHERSLAWILGTYYWGRAVHTHSFVIHGLLQRLRESGLVIQITNQPALVIGACYCACNLLTVDLLAPCAWIDSETLETPFFDQLLPFDLTEGRPNYIHADHDYAVYTSRQAHFTPYQHIEKYYETQMEPTLAAHVFSRYDDYRVENDLIFSDLSIGAVVKPSRVFTEVTFATATQNVLSNALMPNYARYNPYYLTMAILSLYSENNVLHQMRMIYGNRRHTFDDKTLEAVSGMKIGSNAMSLDTARENYQDRIKPAVGRAVSEVKVRFEELSEKIRDLHDKDDPDDDFEGNDSESADVSMTDSIGEEDLQPSLWERMNSWGAQNEVFFFEALQDVSSQLEAVFDVESETLPTPLTKEQEKEEEELLVVDISGPATILITQEEPKADDKSVFDTIVEYCESITDPIVDIATPHIASVASSTVGKVGFVLGSGTSRYFATKGRTPLMTLGKFIQYQELMAECVQRDLLLEIPTILNNTNLIARRGLEVPTLLLSSTPILEPSGFVEGPIFVTWQETHQHLPDGEIMDFDTYGKQLVYDQSRIAIEETDDSPLPPGNFSEVYYGLYLRKARCYNQTHTLITMKQRFGKTIPKPVDSVVWKFRTFCDHLIVPELDPRHEDQIVDRDEYFTYVCKMPTSSQKKHMDYFDLRVQPNFLLDSVLYDAYFVKYDEVIIDRKSRGIINPPPSLFYDLVVWTTAIKDALKRKLFNQVLDHPEFEVFLTYGADLTSAQKSDWFTRAHELVRTATKYTACVLVGGDDNLCLVGRNGTVHSWESDVSACDQSHNSALVAVMLNVLEKMGLPEHIRDLWRSTYKRPLRVKNRWKVFFHKMQLHTGHPQTSVANTILVGIMAIYFCVFGRDAEGAVFVDFVRKLAEELGMNWKVQWNDNPLDSTFHKGFWVPSGQLSEYQWLPLPSCLWKAFKIRTDSYIGHEELLLRMAFNLYQRILSPQVTIVRNMAKAQFTHIMRLLDYDVKNDPTFANISVGYFETSPRMIDFIERASVGKGGEVDKEVVGMAWDCEPYWDVASERAFCRRRYGDPTDEFVSWAEKWDGSFGAYYGYDFHSWIIRDYGVDAEGFEARCEEEILMAVPNYEF